ncbi:hypothetical protein ACEZDB_16395 [Streptacidiphilus sp. N1-3]|uniref:Protein kinase domain-containing protein n=1 Tax=Streptacidiphilus alkalitolerans TaxID=3342712 RepID=A0ABV6X1T0_9ACTN
MTGRTVLLDGVPVPLADAPSEVDDQAALYRIEGRADYIVKIYREPPGPLQERRLRGLLGMPFGSRSGEEAPEPAVAWPTALVQSREGAVLGYAMPLLGDHVKLEELLDPSSRFRLSEGPDQRFLLAVCWNLAFMVARMHGDGIVIGDLSGSSVVVDRNGFVEFIDFESVSFTDPVTEEYFPGTAEPATAASDDFALAVLIFRLLTGSDTAPRGTVDPQALPPPLQELARVAFGPGAGDRAGRPTAEAWLRALDVARIAVPKTVAATGEPAERSRRTRATWRAFLAGVGGTLDLLGGADRPREPLPAFEATLADDVHELCLALGLRVEDENPVGGSV